MQTKIRVNTQEAAELISCSETTVRSIPEDVLPRCRFGRSVGFLVSDIESALRRIADGEIVVEKINR
jgi:hypothetical protein